MARYRKRPVVIEARQIRSYFDFDPVSRWVNTNGGAMSYGQDDPGPAKGLIITLEGAMDVKVSDYVICGVNGEFYPCRADIFQKTYEPVEDES